MMMVKNKARIPNSPQTEHGYDDDELFLDVSSQEKHLISTLIKHGKQIWTGNVGSKFSSMKSVHQSSSIHSGFQVNNHDSFVSLLNNSQQDPAVKSCNSKVECGTEASISRMAIKTDIGAALALMKLSKDVLGFSKMFHSHGGNHNLNGMQDLSCHRASDDNHYQVTAKKAQHFKKCQQTSAEDQMKKDGHRVSNPTARRNPRKRKFRNDFPLCQSNPVEHDMDKEEDNLNNSYRSKDWANLKACPRDGCDRSNIPSLGCNKLIKKENKKADRTLMGKPVESDHCNISSQKVLDELPISSLKKNGVKKVKAEPGFLNGLTASSSSSSRGVSSNAVRGTTPSKKLGLNVITPTLHISFSFSIIHFLSAIRSAMITPEGNDGMLACSKPLEKTWRNGVNRFGCHERNTVYTSQTDQKNLPSLTIYQIVECLRTNPGDPYVLEAKEPLKDLVRGALALFSSKEAPLGAKGWKALTCYSKFNKSWSWVGPVFPKGNYGIEEEISSEVWWLPRRILKKLVDSYANWLRSVQPALRQMGSLPAPPLTLMQTTINMEERLKVVRARKIVATISPCSKEVRDYVQKEETLRYLVPDRAFSYTALDGRKSTVAPVRRSSGKATLKVREHFMLKADRPPQITVLCLVRDAAARLPASMGTRADVSTLLRDSQFLVGNISDEQLNQVVSGALDRLHYETDPCVQFNGDTKLWVYPHRDREEDDFQDDGSFPTRKQKKK